METLIRFVVLPSLCLASAACSSGDIALGSRDSTEAQRSASVPIGIENVNGSAMREGSYRALLRFVPDETIDVARVYFGFKLQGASCWDSGLAGNGAGDGGLLHGMLVTIDEKTGLPAKLLDEETVNACLRHNQASAEVGATPVLGFVEVDATLNGGQMYGLVVRNAHAQPTDNFFSFQMPIADSALAGPQARNELNAQASGSIMRLDPREHVAWSTDDGTTWHYGSDNGEYLSYVNDDEAHPATRIPQYGFRLADGTMRAAQPYYAYRTDCTGCTVVYAAARYRRTFTELGGFTASTGDVGKLTITNTTAGTVSACAPEPGYGFRMCTLPEPVTVAPGEDYSIHASGSVELMHMDQGQRVLFPGVGTPSSEHSAYQPEPAPGTNEKDVPSLWAGSLSAHFPAVGEK